MANEITCHMTNEKRLIDANALKEQIENEIHTYWTNDTGGYCLAEDVIPDIDNAPTVDAVEVVHGRWEKASETMPIYRCSVCKERNLFKNGYNVLSNYCPNCGAKMDGDGNG